MLNTLLQISPELTHIANHLEVISTLLKLMVYMGIMVTLIYVGNSANNWGKS
jgi:hypothetical protein